MGISKCDEPTIIPFFKNFLGDIPPTPIFLINILSSSIFYYLAPKVKSPFNLLLLLHLPPKSFSSVTSRVISSIGVMSLKPSTIASPSTFATVRPDDGWRGQIMHIGSGPVELKPVCVQYRPLEKRTPIIYAIRAKQTSVVCAAALNATCAAEQTQTVTRQSSTITVAPVQGKEKSPELDDGGTGFPPRDDGDGGGGGGGGGGNWSGGFFFFGFLAFLGFLKDQENEGPYRDDRR